MMREVQTKLRGPMAALLTPRGKNGLPDFQALERNLDFVMRAGVRGVVLTGGTGEYFELSVEQRDRLVEDAVASVRQQCTVVASVGAGNMDDCVALGQRALTSGADCLLLPPPHFYHYEQDDLEAFYRAAASHIDGPILIYNLAAFCTPVETDTALRLIESVENIIGIKDSSGSLQTLKELKQRLGGSAIGLLGHDRVLAEGLREGVIDGVISGPAGVVPEIVVALFAAQESDQSGAFERAASLLNELVDRLEAFPYPWALKWIAEWRGLFPAWLPFPPSRQRLNQKAEMERWFDEKLPEIRALGELQKA